MIIKSDTQQFNTDELVIMERVTEKLVVVILESRTLEFRDLEAQQVYCQVTEWAETVKVIR